MAGRSIVFYDGWCPLCVRAAGLVRRLDRLGRLRFVSLRDPGAASLVPMDSRRLQERMVLLTPGGRIFEGYPAVVHTAARVPVLRPLVPGLALLAWLGLGRRLYDFIARNRGVILPGCASGTCGAEPGTGGNTVPSFPRRGTGSRAG